MIIAIVSWWLVIGIWISYKRNWYSSEDDFGFESLAIFANVIFAPISIIIVILREIVLRNWN